MKRVLVTGSNGQLGSELKGLSQYINDIEFTFTDVNQLDITSKESVISFFDTNTFDYCINCAAYTAVDKAEEEMELAELINATGARYLAEITKERNVKYIHISTDFVFSGSKNTPYTELDITEPLNVYGQTKLNGEHFAFAANEESLVIRTSWLYSSFGNNFVKTMIKLSQDNEELAVIVDQIGTPTYAKDLAQAIVKIIQAKEYTPGVYHYSNEGIASWYDFAKCVFNLEEIDVKVRPIGAEEYPMQAQRPSYSVMDKSKIKKVYHMQIPYWRDSLLKCINEMKHMDNV